MDSVKPSLASATSRRRAPAAAFCSVLFCASLLFAAFLLGPRPFRAASFAEPYSKLALPPPPGGDGHGHDVAAGGGVAALPPAPPPEAGGESVEIGACGPAPAGETAAEEEECDLFEGRWVHEHDPAGYPLYEAAECPFLSGQVACRRNGRPDSGYEQWRWQPRGCGGGGTRVRGAEALEQCRNRRVAFVGDSLNRNMWESLACILYTAVPDRSRTRIYVVSSEYRIFHAMDYNCSVEFFWSPFLVKLETKSDRRRALKLDQLPAALQQVLGADILVFNTGHWWTHTGRFRAWDHLERNGRLVEMDGKEAFDRALRTWARWIDHNVDPTKTRVFFRSISPEHKSSNWCYNQTSLITNKAIVPWFPRSLVSTVVRNIQAMRTPVTYLNITHLSELRIDAHPSVYTITRDGKPLSMEQQQQPITYADCSGLPGLPDTWNVLLLASLMRPPSNVHLL